MTKVIIIVLTTFALGVWVGYSHRWTNLMAEYNYSKALESIKQGTIDERNETWSRAFATLINKCEKWYGERK